MKRKPDVIICPACFGWSIYRRKQRCIFCGVLLVYINEYFTDEEGAWIFLPLETNSWELLADYKKRRGL